MALVDTERAKKFKIYKNGDPQFNGKDFVLNKRRIRTWDSFLQATTNDIKSSEAIRSIRTPTNGTRIQNLEELQDSYAYVAVGHGKFKKLGYMNFGSVNQARGKSTSPRNPEVKPVEHSRIQASGRIRKVPVDVVTIHVYANGKELEPARRVTLTHSMLRSWEAILATVTEKVNLTSGAARKLCTLEGQHVTDLSELRTGAQFVAVGADVGGFKKLEYGAQKPAFNSSPKRDRSSDSWKSFRSGKTLTPRRLEPLNHQPKTRSRKGAGSENGTLNSSYNSGSSQNSSSKSSPTNNKPAPIRREREKKPPPARKPPAQKKEGDDVFHAKPKAHKRSGDKNKREVDLDKDEGGVFKAKGENSETADAQEVDDNKDTAVDLPIDQVEAEEVKDEEIDDDKKESPRKTPTPAPRSRKSSAASVKATSKSSTPIPPEDNTDDKNKEDEAATRIQAGVRGYQTRKQVNEKKLEKEKQDLAATKIQASVRGHNTRKQIQKRKEETAKK